MPIIQPTDWYLPPDLPVQERHGLYDVVEAHPLTPKEEDVVLRAYWGIKFGSMGFWTSNPTPAGCHWQKITNVARWRGRKSVPRIPLIAPVTTKRVRLVEQLSLDLPKRRVALLV